MRFNQSRQGETSGVRSHGGRSVVVLVLVTALCALAAAPTANAARRPSGAEARAIERVALKRCERGGAPSPCRFHRSRVSTRNARYAWAEVTTDGFSAVLLRRPSRGSLRFRVIGVQGGGIGDCRVWRRKAPAAVLRDLGVFGLRADGSTGRCG